MKLLTSLCALLFASSLAAAPLHKMVVFGDSLSDNGNLYEYMKHQMPISPPYYNGRFSNGPIWVEVLLQKIYGEQADQHLLDYAFGGAGVNGQDTDNDDDDGLFTLKHEIDSYLLAHQDRADADSLYVIWMGSNNYLALPDDITKVVEDVNWGIKNNIERLIAKGARHFLVVNLPDLGRTPTARDFDAVDVLREASLQHNALLNKNLAELKQTYPQIQWLFFDAFGTLNSVLENPHDYGFTNITDTCYEALVDDHPSSTTVLKMVATIRTSHGNDACDGFLFFDPVHPSAPAHVIMAERLLEQFKQLGVEFQ